VGAAAPDQLLILSGAEQEYLLRVIEAAVQVRDLSQLFLWTQGQLQSLLPHAVMVAMRFDAGGALQRLECLNSNVLDAAAIAHLCDRDAGLAVRAARHWSATGLGQPAMTGRRRPCATARWPVSRPSSALTVTAMCCCTAAAPGRRRQRLRAVRLARRSGSAPRVFPRIIAALPAPGLAAARRGRRR
jgi:hypothetical protein